jgi:transposase
MVSRASIYRWQMIFDEHGTVNRPPSPLIGRTRTLTRTLLTACQTLFEDDSDLFLDEVVSWLAIHHDIVISTSTLSRNLREAGLTRKILHKIAAERDECLRQEWRESIRTNFAGDGTEFVCVDETSKNDLSYARRFGRSQAGERAHLTDVFVRGDRYSLVAALTTEGYIAAHAVEGSLDSFEFYNFIAEKVVRLCLCIMASIKSTSRIATTNESLSS